MSTVDWGMVAVVVALLAYPVQVLAIPPIFSLIARASRYFSAMLWPSSRYCESFPFAHFFTSLSLHSTKKLRGPDAVCEEPRCQTYLTFEKDILSGSWTKTLSLLFPASWSVSRPKVEKPAVLFGQKKYIRTEKDVILLFAHVMYTLQSTDSSNCFSFQGSSYWQPLRLDALQEIVNLSEQDGVLVAKMSFSRRQLRGFDVGHGTRLERTHDHLNALDIRQVREKLDKGFFMFDTRSHLTLLNDVKIAYPVREVADMRRGGWILAFAMAHWSKFYPEPRPPPIFLPWFIQPGLVQSGFADSDMPIKVPQSTADALDRVISTVTTFFGELEDLNEDQQETLHLTSELIESMRGNFRWAPRGSRKPLQESRLFRKDPSLVKPEYMPLREASADTCERIVQIFNWKGSSACRIGEDDAQFIKPILLEVCITAVIGIGLVVEYYARGKFLIEPEELNRHKYVFLEDVENKDEDT